MRSSKTFLVGIVLALLFQTGALAWMVKGHFDDLRDGQEVVLESEMRDPRDFFRGHYTRLNLVASRVTPDKVEIDPDLKYGTAYLALKKAEPFWQAEKLTKLEPETGTFLKVRISSIQRDTRMESGSTKRAIKSVRLDLNISRYYAPKKRALELEDLNRKGKLGVVLSVLDNGASKVKGVVVDGKLIHDATGW